MRNTCKLRKILSGLLFLFLILAPYVAHGLGFEREFTVFKVEKVQYKLKGVWTDVPAGGFTNICKDSKITFKVVLSPSDVPSSTDCLQWGGGASGGGIEKVVEFTSPGARSVTVKCGNTITIPVTVEDNTPVTITWEDKLAHVKAMDDAKGVPSVTWTRDFTIQWRACADIDNNVWRLRVSSVTGGVDVYFHHGLKEPEPGINITIETEAREAISDMLLESLPEKADGTGGPAKIWLSLAALKAHEEWHYEESKCSSNHYWPATRTALENLIKNLTVPLNTYADEAAAIVALRLLGEAGADAKMGDLKGKAVEYKKSLGDDYGDPPYRAGGKKLNESIEAVRNYGLMQEPPWNLPPGENAGPGVVPCYIQDWPPYNP